MTYGRTHLKTVNHSYCEGPPYSNCTGNREPVITLVMVANIKYYWSITKWTLANIGITINITFHGPGVCPQASYKFNKSAN